MALLRGADLRPIRRYSEQSWPGREALWLDLNSCRSSYPAACDAARYAGLAWLPYWQHRVIRAELAIFAVIASVTYSLTLRSQHAAR